MLGISWKTLAYGKQTWLAAGILARNIRRPPEVGTGLLQYFKNLSLRISVAFFPVRGGVSFTTEIIKFLRQSKAG